MTYVFTFLGEFGVELMNWQGVVRKFARTIGPNDRIVVCSRAQVYPMYEVADLYIDLSAVARFQSSRAKGYRAIAHRDGEKWDAPASLILDARLKSEIRSLVRRRLASTADFADDDVTFVFSSEGRVLNGCTFGQSAFRYSTVGILTYHLLRSVKRMLPIPATARARLQGIALERLKPAAHEEAGVYDTLPCSNNVYRRIEVDPDAADDAMGRLGLSKPYLLCQARYRSTPQKSPDRIPRDALRAFISRLAEEVQVVLLSFETGRWLDSRSRFDDLPGCLSMHCSTFPEQAALLQGASYRVFFTEGDFGSHIYIPPFMGLNVTSIAPRSVYHTGNAPIEFWNRNVFRFGGQIQPEISEEVFGSGASIERTVRRILGRKEDAVHVAVRDEAESFHAC